MVKIKVLYVADTAPPKKDGVVRFMLETSTRFNSELVNVSFLLPKVEGAELFFQQTKMDVAFAPVRRFKIADYPPPIAKSKVVRSAIQDADIVFINSIGPLGSRSLKYSKKVGKPVIEFIHSIDWELFAYATNFPDKYAGILKPIVRKLYNKSDLLLVADKKIRVSLRAARIKAPIEIVPLGVDTKKFYPDRIGRVYMRRRLGVSQNFVIGFLGRLSKEKNIGMLVKAFNKVRQKIPTAVLLIIGDGPKRNLVENKEHIIFIGLVDNPENYLQAVDVYVLPSQTETTGLSLIEAMACGLACIATNVGAVPTYLKHNHNGILIDKDNLDANLLALAIETLYKNSVLRNKIKGNAAKTISQFYTWDKTTRLLEKLFVKLVSGPGRT